jgi:hypothetical protein
MRLTGLQRASDCEVTARRFQDVRGHAADVLGVKEPYVGVLSRCHPMILLITDDLVLLGTGK